MSDDSRGATLRDARKQSAVFEREAGDAKDLEERKKTEHRRVKNQFLSHHLSLSAAHEVSPEFPSLSSSEIFTDVERGNKRGGERKEKQEKQKRKGGEKEEKRRRKGEEKEQREKRKHKSQLFREQVRDGDTQTPHN